MSSSTSTSSSQDSPDVLSATRSFSGMTISTPPEHAPTPSTLNTSSPASYLPAEILQHIFSLLCHQDLLRVILVNKLYFRNGNTVLYHNIDLANDDPYVTATLDLLESAPTLSGGFISAKITTRSIRGPKGVGGGTRWIRPNFFQHSTNLQSLHLRGCPFSSPREWRAFEDTLSRVCVKLTHVHVEPTMDDIQLRNFPLSGLTRFSWHTEPDMKWPLQSLISSFSTLTTVAFIGRVRHVGGNALDRLLSMHFPVLTTIDLGCLVSASPDTNSKLTQFLFRHRSIQRLSLGREDLRLTESDPVYRIQLPEDSPQHEAARREFLPDLYHLECLPITLASLITLRAPFLSRLTSLSLASIRQDINDITFLQDAHPDVSMLFPSICRLRFQFPITHQEEFTVTLDNGTIQERSFWQDWQNYSSQRQLEMMAWAAYQFSQTTSWEGDLPPMHGMALASYFALYVNVETISVPQKTLLHADPRQLVAFFNPLALTCPNLKHVVGRKPKYSEKTLDSVFTFIREGASLSAVITERVRDATELIESV